MVGGTVLRRAAIQSPNYVAGVSGWTVNQDGSAEFNNLTIRGVFKGTHFEIDQTGAFFYNGTPALGNPPYLAITTATTDPFGNSVQPADSPAASPEFIVLGSGGSYLQAAVQAGLASLLLGSGDGSESSPGILVSGITGAGGTRQLVTELESPDFPAVNPATIQLFSDSFDGTVKSQINLNCVNRTVLGVSGNAWWSDNTGVNGQLNLPASGGPFIFGETFHPVSLAGGLSGQIRIKKTPWNMIYLDVLVSWATTSATTFTCGNLPDASYYPTVNMPNGSTFLPLASNMTPSGTSAAPRVVVPSSGALQVIVPASTGGGNGAFRGLYATN